MLLRLDITAENNDFANVTLACEDSHEAEAHKVILDGSSHQTTIHTRVVKADFLKAVREAVAQRLIKAVKRLLYVVNKTNDCFKMHLTSVRLWASTFHY